MDWQLAIILGVTLALLAFATWDLIVFPILEDPDDE